MKMVKSTLSALHNKSSENREVNCPPMAGPCRLQAFVPERPVASCFHSYNGGMVAATKPEISKHMQSSTTEFVFGLSVNRSINNIRNPNK
ncbi:hypothetical protein AAKU58_000380 [Oxalobacteraceae bacterium GrIS 1.18]